MDGQSKMLSESLSNPQEDLRKKRSAQGRASRRKGQSSEREVFSILSEHLGTVVRRNVDQARNGGADCIEIPGWAIEVKRVESGFQSAWWEQALRQAEKADACPALAYRASRQPWRVRMLLRDAVECLSAWPSVDDCHMAWTEMDLATFAFIVRESLPVTKEAA